MKELQYQIERILNESAIRRRALALITALSILITFIVPYMAIKPGVAQGNDYKHNFTENDLQSEIFTFTNCTIGTAATPITYDSITYSKYLDFYKDDAEIIRFYAPCTGKLVFYHDRDSNKRINLNGNNQSYGANTIALVDGSMYKSEWNIPAGENTIERNENYKFYYMEFIPDEPLFPDSTKYYTIKNKETGRFLSYKDNTFEQSESGDSNNCKFRFDYARDGKYYIQVLADGLENNYLQVNGNTISVAAKSDVDAQKFIISKNTLDTSVYKIGCNGNVFVDATTYNYSVGAFSGNETWGSQKFVFEETTYTPPTGDDEDDSSTGETLANIKIGQVYEFGVNSNNKEGYKLAVDDTLKLIQSIDATRTHFEFKEPDNEGYYFIENLETGKYLTIENSGVNKSITLADKTEDTNKQKFKIVADSGDPEKVNFVSKYQASNDRGTFNLVINATHAEGSTGVSLYYDNDPSDNNPKNKRFTLIESSYTPSETPPTDDPAPAFPEQGKAYTIMTESTDKYLKYNGTNIEQSDYAGGTSYQFMFEYAGNGYYYIKTVDKEKYLEAEFVGEGKTNKLDVVAKNENEVDQKFILINNGDGTYTIQCTNGAIDANRNGESVSTYRLKTEEENNDNQKFVIAEYSADTPVVTTAATTAPTVTTTVTTTVDTTKVYKIEVENGKADYQLAVDDNNMLIQDAEADAGKTHFKFEGPDEEGYYLIKNLETGKYLTLTGTNPRQDDSIMLEDYNYLNDLNRQKFKLVVDPVNNEMVNFVSKYEFQTDIPLVINASNGTGDSQNKVTIYRANDTRHPENKRFTLVESSYEVNTKIKGEITRQGNSNEYQLVFSQASNIIYLYVDLGTSEGATGTIGETVYYGENNELQQWVQYSWTANESGYIAIDLNEFSSDEAIREALLQQPFNGKVNIWWSSNNDAKITDAYIMNEQASNNTPEYKPIESGNVRIEARVIFGDYNDDDDPDHNYSDLDPTPKFQLHSRNGDTKTAVGEEVFSNVVIDTSNARKDWCYQYNYYWDVAPIGGSETNKGYYVELVGDKTTINGVPVIEINDKQYYVYYLRDDRLGHPGLNDDIEEYKGAQNLNGNGGRAEYPVKPEHSFRNDSGAIYIYLDPLEDWQWNKEEHPATIDISMKKRWDGHNAGGVGIRPKEKIEVQLQRWNGSEWKEYNNQNFSDNYVSIIYYEKDNVSNNFVDKTFIHEDVPLVSADVPEDQRLTRVVPGKGEVAWKTPDGDYVNKTVLEQAQGAKDGATVDKANRLELVLDYNEWNNVILSYDKGNKPSHFQQGYYMNWKALPYGQYRVIETASFYDANDNDVLDTGDRDTSSEYYYMSFPPSRDSKGVLHIQNFTKDMVIEVQKEWYDDQGKTKIDKTQKTVNFKVYRSTAMLKNPTAAQLGDPIYTLTTDSNGHLLMKTTDTEHDYSKLKLKDDNDRKYYYYIQEVSVEGVSADEYTLKNGNSEGFVRSTNGSYYIDYEGGDARKFFIQNKVKVGITLNKEWYTDKNSNSKMTFAEGSEPNAEFEIYVSDRLGTPLYDNGAYKVNYEYYTGNSTTGKSTQAITYIADAKIDETGKLEIIGGDINDGNGTSKVMSNQLHIYGTEEVFNGTKTFNADATTKGVFEPQNAPWQKENDYYILPGNKDNRLYVKPRHGFGGILELTFEKVQDTDHIRWFDGDNKYLNEFDDYESGKDLVVTYQMYDGDNKYICRTGVEGTTVPRLKSAVFYPYNYYYIREKTGDTCELINGDSNGFVKNGDDTYYTQITAANRTPTVTAKNTPKNTELDINKEWYTAETDGIVLEDLSKSATFEIYKGYQQGKPTNDGNDYKVNSETLTKLTYIEGLTYNNGFTTNEKGELNATNLPAYEKIGDEYKKVYYYVREVDGDYKLITEGAANGFIADGAGNYGSFFDESNISETEIARTYTFKNVPQLKLQVQKTWAQDKTTGNEVKVHLYRSTDLSVANIERGNMKTSAPTAQTELDETDNTATKTLSAGVYRAGTMNRMLAKLESDESITTLGQVISNEEVPVVYNSLKTLAEDNIDGYYVETLTIKSADSWKYTKTLPVYDNTGALYYYWVVEDVDSAAGYNVDYSSSDNDSSTSNCINADNSGGGIIQVINSLEVIVILPETGGSGTHGYTAAGGIVVLLSAAVLLLKRRKKTL